MNNKSPNTPPLQTKIASLVSTSTSAGHSTSGVTPRVQRSPDNRFRCQFRFWVDANKAEEYELGMALKDLTQKRQFLPTVHNALHLILDLRAGRTDVLIELFPWVVDSLKSVTPPRDSGELQRQISAAVAAGLQQIMLELPAIPAPSAEYPVMKLSSAAPVPEIEIQQTPMRDIEHKNQVRT
jgi:hypothetical protein